MKLTITVDIQSSVPQQYTSPTEVTTSTDLVIESNTLDAFEEDAWGHMSGHLIRDAITEHREHEKKARSR